MKAIPIPACKHRYHWRRTFFYQILRALNGISLDVCLYGQQKNLLKVTSYLAGKRTIRKGLTHLIVQLKAVLL